MQAKHSPNPCSRLVKSPVFERNNKLGRLFSIGSIPFNKNDESGHRHERGRSGYIR